MCMRLWGYCLRRKDEAPRAAWGILWRLNASALFGFVLRTNLMIHRLGDPKEAHVSKARHGAPGFFAWVGTADSLQE